MTHYIGAHTLDVGGIDMAVRRAASAEMTALQIFTTIPKFYGDKSTIRPERVARFRAALAASRIAPDHVIAHAAYVLNTASPEQDKWTRARDGLAKELERATMLGIGVVCFHPGAATDGDRDAAAARVAGAIRHALETVPNTTTRVLIENTAGAGRTFARTAQEVELILSSIPKELRARTGYGLDTCHLFASGYVLHDGGMTRVLDEFQEQTGEAPGFMHLNDSAGELGSNKDRHMLIGQGQIGVDPFRQLLADPRSHGIPLVLETPQMDVAVAEDDAAADRYDMEMLALLRSLSP